MVRVATAAMVSSTHMIPHLPRMSTSASYDAKAGYAKGFSLAFRGSWYQMR